jgi:hypothetical protein
VAAGPSAETETHPELPGRRPKPGPGPAVTPLPAPRPRRPDPRSGAGHAPTTALQLGDVAEDPAIKAPGLGAFLRRHPKAGRRTAVGAIATGVAVFVMSCLTTPLASANVAAPPASPPVDLPFGPLLSAPPTFASPAVQTANQDPRKAKKQAPVSHGVISGLAANGIPKVALNAYRVAAARLANVDPGCGIDWALLAGIGREESDHGRFAGAVLHSDGVSTPRIIGPALDGAKWDYIPAPANGLQLDGDAKYAHALGPMQFIPSTWDIYGTDANGDGNADIFNINDAALAAARYLCAAGGNLRTHDGQVRAVLAYNHSDQYLAQVLALADAYRRGIPVSGIPVGITTGPLPTITDTGYIPPANPGAPTAAGKNTSTPTAKPKPAATSSATSPKPSTSSASTPTKAAGTSATSQPAPSSTPTGTSSAPQPAPSPTPSPSPSCNPLNHLLGKC